MNSINNLLPAIKKDYPNIKFAVGEDFHWSPKDNTIYYSSHQQSAEHGTWALLHEVAHAQLGHQTYLNDFDLIKLESKTWQLAYKLGKKYSVNIDKEYIQDCIDTYRDWLHSRATCPNCNIVSMQRDDLLYQCFNCKTTWKVPSHPLTKTKKVIIKNNSQT